MNKIIKFARINSKPLISSFLLALLLWTVVAMNRVYRYQKEFKLEMGQLAEGFVLLNPPPQKVRVEVSGKGTSLMVLGFYDISLNLNLPDINKNTTIELEKYKNRFDIPAELNIDIIEILDPKRIELEVDRLLKVKLPVQLESHIRPVAGYVYLSTKLSDDSVMVVGPASVVQKIPGIHTMPFERTDVRYPFGETIELMNPQPETVLITPAVIKAEFVIEQLVERNLYNIPIQFIGVPDNLVATAVPPFVSVRVKGPESLVSALKNEEITIVYNYAREYRENIERYPMDIRTPPRIEVLETSPEEFRLQLSKKE